METIHVTDEQVQTARVEDALRDVAQRLMGLGLPVAVSAMPEINRLLACQETHSTIYVGFSNQNRMFGDDIATLRIFADVNFQSIDVASSPWSFFRLLEKATWEGLTATWRIENEAPGPARGVRFAFDGDPWALFKVSSSRASRERN